jgi:hypothetical protein
MAPLGKLLLKTFVASLAFDVLACMFLLRFAEPTWTGETLVYTLLFLWALFAVMGFYNACKAGLFFWAFGQEDRVLATIFSFRDAGLPRPDADIIDGQDYLTRLSMDETLPFHMRAFAISLQAQVQNPSIGMLERARIRRVLNEVVERYQG